jgi:hypothetical protein
MVTSRQLRYIRQDLNLKKKDEPGGYGVGVLSVTIAVAQIVRFRLQTGGCIEFSERNAKTVLTFDQSS